MRLCTGIALLPAWPAWRLALDAAQLDQLSGGRFTLGVGLGSAGLREHAGWSADAAGPRADETLQALRRLWSGASEFHGQYLRVDGPLPIRPVSQGGPPIWVGGSIRRSAVRAARHGNGWYGGINTRLSRVPTNIGWYHAALAAEGKATTSGAVVLNRLALTAATAAEVAEARDRYLAGTLQSYARGQALDEVIADMALIGTPDEIVAQVERYRAVGVTHLFARLSLEAMPTEVALRTIELFGREVIPRLAPRGSPA
jgi:alkanesulfonate monooxygenase SsuD/methylene tetrahydromethanopterin reductase-like flavin-dependent oxidoreductase (luciferase family)